MFAFFAAGFTIGGPSGLTTALTDPVAGGIVTGLVIGKTTGVLGSTYLVARFTRAQLVTTGPQKSIGRARGPT